MTTDDRADRAATHILTEHAECKDVAVLLRLAYLLGARDALRDWARANEEQVADRDEGPIRPNDIDDPLLEERRSFTRRHNASLSGWRRV